MHLGHVRAPQHERVRRLDVVVAAHRLVDAEGAHKADSGRGHAVPRVGIEIVGAEARLHQLQCGVTFPDRPLPGPEHADPARAALLQCGLEFLRHDVERLIPRDRRELAVLVEFAVRLAQHRPGETVVAVHDLGKEVAFHAIQPAIDFGFDVAMGCDHAVVLGGDHHAAAGAAEPARRLVPVQFAGGPLGDEVGGDACSRHSTGECGHCGGLELQKLTAIELGSGHDGPSEVRRWHRWHERRARRNRRRAIARWC